MSLPQSPNAQIDEIQAARRGERRVTLRIYCGIHRCARSIATVYATPHGRIVIANGKKRLVPADPVAYAIPGWRDMTDNEREQAVHQQADRIIAGDEPWPIVTREGDKVRPTRDEELRGWLTHLIAEMSDVQAGFWHDTADDARNVLWLDDDPDDADMAVPCRRHSGLTLTAGEARRMVTEAARKKTRSTALVRYK